MSRNKPLAVPMKATKKPLVLQDLNDDCLMEIMSHMSLTDILKMVSVNRRFLAIAPLKAVAKKCHSIEGYNIKKYHEDLLQGFFTALATKCGSLELVHFDESTLRTCLFSLQNLTELSLKNISLSVQNVQGMPRKLKCLTLDNCDFEESYDSETWWFECLSPTLNQLTIKLKTVKGLEELKNLTHFHIENPCQFTPRLYIYESVFRGAKNDEVKMIKETLDNNRNTLTSLNIHKGYSPYYYDFQLGEFKYLQTLSVELFTSASLPVISCVNLVTLTIRFYQSDDLCYFNPVNNFLAALNCGKSLQKLTLDFDFIVDVDLSDFENLRHLELRGGRSIPDLRHQTNLETLIVDNLNFRSWDEFYNIELPFESLRTLILREIIFTRDRESTEEMFEYQVQCARRWLEDQVPSTCKWEFSVSRKEKKFQCCH